MSFLGNIVDQGVSRVAMLNPQVQDRIDELEGKALCLELTAPAIKRYLVITAGELRVLSQTDQVADVMISGSTVSFIRFATSGASASTLSSYQISISGDMETGQKFQDLFAQLDLDWEELLAQHSNDMIARKVGNFVRRSVDWGKEVVSLSEENMADYLKEEIKILPVREMANQVKHKAETLRQDADRLQKRVEMLQQKLQRKFEESE